VLSPAAPDPDLLVAFNTPSLEKFGPTVRENGVIIYDSTVVSEVPKVKKGVRLYPVPCTRLALESGKMAVKVKNVVALGALQAATDLFPEETFLSTIQRSLGRKALLIPINEEAFRKGVEWVKNLSEDEADT
jgi:Pyruvate/2-oxoacid:ferredoxin oxidoreductase gamma subunit